MQGRASANIPLATTANWTAAVRARETRRADRLFNDEWADALAGPQGEAWAARWSADEVLPIVLRTRFFDDFLLGATVDGGARQVVLMATGLDTRAFRLDWPARTHVFELDQPELLKRKQRILHAAGAEPRRCVRKVLPIDLTMPWAQALLDAGFDPRRPSAWLLEGFLYYLPQTNLLRLFDEITDLSAPSSRVGFDIINGAMLTSPWTAGWVQMQASCGAPWIGTVDDPERLLASRGWKADVTQPGQPGVHHGRWHYPVLPVRMPFMPHHWFVTADRR